MSRGGNPTRNEAPHGRHARTPSELDVELTRIDLFTDGATGGLGERQGGRHEPANRRNRENAGPRHADTRYDESRDHRGNERSTDVATTQPVVKFTYEDYLATPSDERYELLDGDLIMVPAPNLKHQKVQGRLHYRLIQFILERKLGELLLAPCDVYLSDTNVVQPDLLFVSRKREHLLSDGQKVQGAPDLVI